VDHGGYRINPAACVESAARVLRTCTRAVQHDPLVFGHGVGFNVDDLVMIIIDLVMFIVDLVMFIVDLVMFIVDLVMFIVDLVMFFAHSS
jgi:hypothetical protein